MKRIIAFFVMVFILGYPAVLSCQSFSAGLAGGMALSPPYADGDITEVRLDQDQLSWSANQEKLYAHGFHWETGVNAGIRAIWHFPEQPFALVGDIMYIYLAGTVDEVQKIRPPWS